MIRNIEFPEVEKVSVAIVPGETETDVWSVYIINENDFELKNILVNSKGYGEKDGSAVKTSTLKHFFEIIAPNTAMKIESIQPEVFGLTNEFWVSFYAQNKLFDKKYVFTSGAIDSAHLTDVPLIKERGILHP